MDVDIVSNASETGADGILDSIPLLSLTFTYGLANLQVGLVLKYITYGQILSCLLC